MEKKKKYYSKKDAKTLLEGYCAYQDRCHQEVREKLIETGIYGDDIDDIMCDLIADNFLNEERFARSYARGKFRIKHWGKIKIQLELKQKKISAYCLKKAMEEIEDEEYMETLEKLLVKKARTTKFKNQYDKKGKLAQYAMQKGFESFIVWELLKVKEF